MSHLSGYRAAVTGTPGGFDELWQPDGQARPGWDAVAAAVDASIGNGELARAERDGRRLLNDHGVTIVERPTPTILEADAAADEAPAAIVTPSPWHLDPIPAVFGGREWNALAEGVAQRTRLLDAVLADIYGPRELMAEGLLPAAAILDHPEYLRPAVGGGTPSQLVIHAVDLGRDTTGTWVALSDRTQAPSGAGYALMNRRVTTRVMPDVSATASIARLSPFFASLRRALVTAAPEAVADPRVVVLSPGALSETAYDQSLLASTLGFPLVEGADLTVRDGRVYMRVLGDLEPVHVIWRRIDSRWADPLELRAGSRLGVAGLMECVRTGTVSVVNSLGSGALENPALMPYLPRLCQELLGENLRLDSVTTWWCGDEASRSHVLAHLEQLVVRTTSRNGGRGIVAGELTAEQRATLRRHIERNPQRYVGQELLTLSTTPMAEDGRVVPMPLNLRAFCVRDGAEFHVMDGGLASPGAPLRRPREAVVTSGGRSVSKDVWVIRDSAVPGAGATEAELRPAGVGETAAMVPRVLSDMHWIGRYAERGEALARLLLAGPMVMDGSTRSGDRWMSAAAARYFEAITHLTGSYPGMLDPTATAADEIRRIIADPTAPGSIAQSLGRLTIAAQEVRDQLSDDLWLAVAAAERALALVPPAGAPVASAQLFESSERVLTAFLAIAGVVGDNMIHDPGWFMLDAGRAWERSNQVVRLLRATLAGEPVEGEASLVDAVMMACESIVTFRRRYPSVRGVPDVVELIVKDPRNPRAVRHQLERIRGDLGQMPGASQGSRPMRLVERLAAFVDELDPVRTAETGPDGWRAYLASALATLADGLGEVQVAIDQAYLKRAPVPQVMSATAWETPE